MRRWIIVPLVALGLVWSVISSAFAERMHSGGWVDSVTESSIRGNGAKQTRTVQFVREYTNLYGVVVVRHISTTTWSWSDGYLFSSPKSVDVDWYTAPGYIHNGDSKQWDWYNAGQGGTGRSNTQLSVVAGIPTPWGPIGSTISSRILTDVDGWGRYDAY